MCMLRHVYVATEYPTFFRSMSIVTAKRLKILYQIMLNRRQIPVLLMKNRQILGQNDTTFSIIQHPTKGSQKFNTLQVEWYYPINKPLCV